MKKRIVSCFVITFVVSVFGLAACGGGDEAQQQLDQQGTQPGPPSPAQSGNRAASGLIGTWELVSDQGESLPGAPGTQSVTFTDDGTFQTKTNLLGEDATDEITTTGEYRVLDDSRIQFTSPDMPEYVQEYSLDGDTLTYYMRGVPYEFQRTS